MHSRQVSDGTAPAWPGFVSAVHFQTLASAGGSRHWRIPPRPVKTRAHHHSTDNSFSHKPSHRAAISTGLLPCGCRHNKHRRLHSNNDTRLNTRRFCHFQQTANTHRPHTHAPTAASTPHREAARRTEVPNKAPRRLYSYTHKLYNKPTQHTTLT